jgi:ATP-dependent Lon protease
VLRKTATGIASAEPEASAGGEASGGDRAPVDVTLEVVRDALGRQKVWQEAALRTAVPGVATGLAVTGTGGDVLFVEATEMKGKAGMTLTGQLAELGIDEDAFEDREFHVHVPAGAIPKDGPSAGVTMTTALASLLSGRPVKHTVGMTGEVTLQGRVLPIGGVKQKVLAAHAAGLTEVILPERNRGDLDDVPAEVREAMTFHLAMSIDEVLDHALDVPSPGARSLRRPDGETVNPA